MNQDKYLEILKRLIGLTQEYRFRYSDTRDYEPIFFAVLMYVKSAKEDLRQIAEIEFVKMLQEPGLRMHELIGYCMRELKFKSVKEAAISLLNETEDSPRYLARRRILLHILNSYEDHWDDDITYSYYREKYDISLPTSSAA